MSHARLWISAAIIAGIVLVVFAFSVPHTRDLGAEESLKQEAPAAPAVSLEDSFRRGTRSFSGSVPVSSACSSATAEALFAGDASSTPPHIVLSISTIEPEGVCLRLPGTAEFSASLEAPEEATLEVRVNGATTTILAL